MAYTRLILLSSLLAVVVDQTLAGKCKKGEVSSIAGTACYVVREPAPWALAEANCHSLVNGHLAVAGQDDYFELNGILRQQHEQNLGNSNLFWIGGRVESGSWKWSTYDQAGQHVYSGISNPSWDNGTVNP